MNNYAIKQHAADINEEILDSSFGMSREAALYASLAAAKMIDKQRELWGVDSAKAYWSAVINELEEMIAYFER
jgi:hypothetical protein